MILPKHHSELTFEFALQLRIAGYEFRQATLYAVTDKAHGDYRHVYYVRHSKNEVRPWVIKAKGN